MTSSLFEFAEREGTDMINVKEQEIFARDVKTIGRHIGNALREELDTSTVAKFATVRNDD